MTEYQHNLTIPESPDDQSSLILVCFLTDIANTPKSRRVGIMSTGTLPVMKFIANGIRRGRMSYRSPMDEDDEALTPEDQYANFIADWNDTPPDALLHTFNGRLCGCALDTAINGRTYTPLFLRK